MEIFYYVTRTLIAGAVATIAGFAIKQSGHHRSRGDESKRLANQLSTFRPFLAEIDEVERNALVKEASERYFPGYDGRHTVEALTELIKDVKSTSDEKRVVDMLMNFFKNLRPGR